MTSGTHTRRDADLTLPVFYQRDEDKQGFTTLFRKKTWDIPDLARVRPERLQFASKEAANYIVSPVIQVTYGSADLPVTVTSPPGYAAREFQPAQIRVSVY
jgi:hypothetical protein